MGDSGGTADSSVDGFRVGVLLSLDLQSGVDGDRVEPVVAVVASGGVAVDLDAFDPVEQFAVEVIHMPVVCDVLLEHRHLTAADARADVGHAVVVADFLVLVVRVCLSGLGGVEHDFLLALHVRADQRAAAGGGDHLVAVEREYAEAAESAADLSVEAAPEALGRVFDDGDAVFFADGEDFIDSSGHAIQINRNDGLGLPSGFCYSVLNRSFQQFRVHVPGIRFRIHEDRCGSEVADRVGGCAEGEALDQHFVAGLDAAGDERKVDCGGSGRECHHFLAGSDEVLEVFLKRVDVGSERHDPVSVESLLDILHFRPAHVSETEVDTGVHDGIYY